ncbi:MAG TPA: TfoX/Sxy family protein [Vicinamibacterales bacterium]|jgi:TfoX/Sxy family transcriptional regulator of competence genes
MPYDEELAARIRRLLRRTAGISERKMFAGLAFMCHGKMCCGIVGPDLMVRVREKDMSSALRRAHVRPMDFTGKPLRGFVYVGAAGVTKDSSLREWVRKGVAFVKTNTRRTRGNIGRTMTPG